MKNTKHAHSKFSPETMELPPPVKFWVDVAALQSRLLTSYWEGYFRGFEEIYYGNLREWNKGNQDNETTR